MKRELMTGAAHQQTVKYDLQPVTIRPNVSPYESSKIQVATKQLALMTS